MDQEPAILLDEAAQAGVSRIYEPLRVSPAEADTDVTTPV